MFPAVLAIVLVKIKICIVQHSLVVKLADRIHCLMHTVGTYGDMVGQLEHFSGFALRAPAYEAHILILAFLLLIQSVHSCLILFLRILFVLRARSLIRHIHDFHILIIV